jgi:hypothetical protein
MGAARKAGGSLLTSIAPFAIFMVAGWYGLATVVQTKRDVRVRVVHAAR